jgi:hypothetical protein
VLGWTTDDLVANAELSLVGSAFPAEAFTRHVPAKFSVWRELAFTLQPLVLLEAWTALREAVLATSPSLSSPTSSGTPRLGSASVELISCRQAPVAMGKLTRVFTFGVAAGSGGGDAALVGGRWLRREDAVVTIEPADMLMLAIERDLPPLKAVALVARSKSVGTTEMVARIPSEWDRHCSTIKVCGPLLSDLGPSIFFACACLVYI